MTSKNLFFRLVKEDFKRRVWSFALISVILFFTLPVAAGLIMSYQENSANAMGDIELALKMSRVKSSAMGVIDTSNLFLELELIFFSVITCLSGFGYLFKKQRTDFYHGLPIKREWMYSIVITDSILIIAVPYFLFNFLTALMISVRFSDFSVLGQGMYYFLMHTLGMILCMMVANIAIMLTGQPLISLFGILIFYFYAPVMLFLKEWYYSTYYLTYVERVMDTTEKLPYLSPVFYALLQTEGTGEAVIKIITIICWSIALFILGMVLYKKRKSEYTGRAMTFKITEAPIKFLLVIPFGLLGAIIMGTVMNSNGWLVFGLICGAVISHCVIEIIYHSDFKRIFANTKHVLAAMTVTVLIVLCFQFDWTGFDRYIPKESKLESAGIYSDHLEDDPHKLAQKIRLDEHDMGENVLRSENIYGSYDEMEKEVLSKTKIKDYGIILALAESGMEDLRVDRDRLRASGDWGDYSGWEMYDEYGERKNNVVTLYITYHLKNGRSVERMYPCDIEKMQEALEAVHNDETFKKAVYPILSEKTEDIQAVNFMGITEELSQTITLESEGIKGTLPISEEKMKNLIEGYKEELMGITYSQRKIENPIGTIRFSDTEMLKILLQNMRGEDSGKEFAILENYDGYYPIYPSFTKTIAALREAGCMVVTEIKKEDVESIVVYPRTMRKDSVFEERTITDPEEIAVFLPMLDYANLQYENSVISSNHNPYLDIEIKLKGKLKEELIQYNPSFGEAMIIGEARLTDAIQKVIGTSTP